MSEGEILIKSDREVRSSPDYALLAAFCRGVSAPIVKTCWTSIDRALRKGETPDKLLLIDSGTASDQRKIGAIDLYRLTFGLASIGLTFSSLPSSFPTCDVLRLSGLRYAAYKLWLDKEKRKKEYDEINKYFSMFYFFVSYQMRTEYKEWLKLFVEREHSTDLHKDISAQMSRMIAEIEVSARREVEKYEILLKDAFGEVYEGAGTVYGGADRLRWPSDIMKCSEFACLINEATARLQALLNKTSLHASWGME